uniref:Uncharacterized protein n=1 Tax=Pyramimonas orientalis virus TaxID=455367 RepID=A0A7M3UNU8_POV01|nr:hypothetical protein HWQ62_00248 [Pyramimonas orientalis virus]
MIEFLSNFYLKNKYESEAIPNESEIYVIDTLTIEDKLPVIVNDYKDFKTIVVVYSCTEDVRYFLGLFTKHYCNIKSRGEFEDILLMNHCILL